MPQILQRYHVGSRMDMMDLWKTSRPYYDVINY